MGLRMVLVLECWVVVVHVEVDWFGIWNLEQRLMPELILHWLFEWLYHVVCLLHLVCK